MKNDIVWSDVGSGFGEPGGTPLQRIPGSTPPGISPLFPPLKTDNNSGTKLRKFHTNNNCPKSLLHGPVITETVVAKFRLAVGAHDQKQATPILVLCPAAFFIDQFIFRYISGHFFRR